MTLLYTNTMWHWILVILCVCDVVEHTYGGYPCVCSYQLETPVYSTSDVTSPLIGHFYEFDCLSISASANTAAVKDFIPVSFNGQNGFVHYVPGFVETTLCQGTTPSVDPATTLETITTTPQFVAVSATSPWQQITTQILSTTTQLPTTTSTTTKAPTTTSTTTQASTTTSTTTQAPTTTPTTTQAPTTTSTTPQAPTTTPTTTQAPTTTSTTTQPPTTTPTTTQAPTAPKPIFKCPDRFVLHGDSCYMYVVASENRVTYDEAVKRCHARNSHLIFIENEEEQKMVEDYLKANSVYQHTLGHTDDIHHTALWTGGMKFDRLWKWSDTMTHANIDIQHTYIHYTDDFPKHSHANEICLAVVGSQNYQWRDFWCDDEFLFICETHATMEVPQTHNVISHSTPKPVTTTSTTTPKPTPSQTGPCPDGWFLHADSCYLFNVNQRLTHTDASTQCQQRQSHLIIINDKGEQNMVVDYLNRNHVFSHILSDSDDFHLTTIWTAGVKENHRFQWLDTMTNTYTDMVSHYHNWSSNFPYHSSDRDSCIGVIGMHHYHWRDFRCYDKFFYICEKPALHRVQLIG